VTVAILDVFYLLPSTASKFLDQLIAATISLETIVRRYSSSPFRAPLTKFFNKYPVESVDYFYNKLSTNTGNANEPSLRLFLEILDTELASPLRKEITNNPARVNIFQMISFSIFFYVILKKTDFFFFSPSFRVSFKLSLKLMLLDFYMILFIIQFF